MKRFAIVTNHATLQPQLWTARSHSRLGLAGAPNRAAHVSERSSDELSWQQRQGRTHLVRALLYVDLNPVRAGLVGRAEEYPWSSARVHTEGADPSGTLDLGSWSEICSANDWGEALVGGADAVDAIRTATRAGNPFGDDRFVAELESQAGRLLRSKPPGPQPKSRVAAA